MLRNYGQKDRYTALIPQGINSRLDEVQAAILSFRLKGFERDKRRKLQIAERYLSELRSLPLSFQYDYTGLHAGLAPL